MGQISLCVLAWFTFWKGSFAYKGSLDIVIRTHEYTGKQAKRHTDKKTDIQMPHTYAQNPW